MTRIIKLQLLFGLLFSGGHCWPSLERRRNFFFTMVMLSFSTATALLKRLYTSDIENFALTGFPDRHVRFVNSGVSGDKVSGGIFTIA